MGNKKSGKGAPKGVMLVKERNMGGASLFRNLGTYLI